MKYISYTQVVSQLPISKGDCVIVAADLVPLLCACREHKEIFNVDLFINSFLEAVGNDGTMVFPTFNWDYCKGIPFDLTNSPSQTGALGQAALQRNDFKRTQHPIYSFAVWGKHQTPLCALNNVSGFAEDSPFEYMVRIGTKQLFIGVHYREGGFAFVHYVEERVGVNYRVFKDFHAIYIDNSGIRRQSGVRMYVRKPELCAITLTSPKMEETLSQLRLYQDLTINSIPFGIMDVTGTVKVLIENLREGGGYIYPKRP